MEGGNNLNDLVLWQSFTEGNDNGLEGIYRLYFNDLYNYGFKWLGNVTLVEDSIQDLFIKLMRNRHNLSQPVSVKHYLFRALRTTLLDKLKTKNKPGGFDDIAENQFVLHVSPELEMINREDESGLKKKLQQAIGQLTARQREAIFLRYIEGISYEEISAILELTPKATYKLMARALDALREQMPVLAFLIASYYHNCIAFTWDQLPRQPF